MLYKSTRGIKDLLNFKEVTLKGLAEDGGLYIPNEWNKTKLVINEESLEFKKVAKAVVENFTGDLISKRKLNSIIDASYKNFPSREIVPLKKITNNLWMLELFHGPTLAFKDIALQFLGNLFDHFLSTTKTRLTIIGATSGDTGSAAIEAIKNQENSNIFILHPYNRVSEFQRRQMTTVNTKNVFNIAVRGTFDDCQALVKKLFNDKDTNSKVNLGSINSINWTRIMAQISYYIFAYHKMRKKTDKDIVFSVPTGNFGDAYAGYIAKEKFNIPFKKILVATNKNDILDKFFKTGIYKKTKVSKTLSPSMDIQIASNFERFLYDLYDEKSNIIKNFMKKFNENDLIKVDSESLDKTKSIFYSSRVTEKETIDTIKKIYNLKNIIIDPHTAVGLKTGFNYLEQDNNCVVITLATAHPIKFSKAVNKALGLEPKIPKRYKKIYSLKEKYLVIDNNFKKIKDYIISNS